MNGGRAHPLRFCRGISARAPPRGTLTRFRRRGAACSVSVRPSGSHTTRTGDRDCGSFLCFPAYLQAPGQAPTPRASGTAKAAVRSRESHGRPCGHFRLLLRLRSSRPGPCSQVRFEVLSEGRPGGAHVALGAPPLPAVRAGPSRWLWAKPRPEVTPTAERARGCGSSPHGVLRHQRDPRGGQRAAGSKATPRPRVPRTGVRSHGTASPPAEPPPARTRTPR